MSKNARWEIWLVSARTGARLLLLHTFTRRGQAIAKLRELRKRDSSPTWGHGYALYPHWRR